jgi:hypothetical protein
VSCYMFPSNSWSSCFNLQSAGIISMYHHTHLKNLIPQTFSHLC